MTNSRSDATVYGSPGYNITTGEAGAASLAVYLSFYLSSSGISNQVSDHLYHSRSYRDTGCHIATNSARIRFTNNRDRWSLSLPWGEMLLCINQSEWIKDKLQHFWMTLQKCKKYLNVSGQWIIDNSIHNWILTFLTPPILLFLILLVKSCLINFLSGFLQQKTQKISTQTFNQLLL